MRAKPVCCSTGSSVARAAGLHRAATPRAAGLHRAATRPARLIRAALRARWACLGACIWLSASCSDSPPAQLRRGQRASDAAVTDVGEIDTNLDANVALHPLPDAGMQAADEEDAGPRDTTGCGDGKLQRGEACDDGNSVSGDGCSADCSSQERDYVCPAPGRACVSSVVCADGRVSGGETCDDGNDRDADGCSAHCEIEPGYRCPTPGAVCVAAKCGDGLVAGDEACDDGNDHDGDGCSADCRLEPGYACPKPGEACRPTVCNDGVREGSEACDDGNAVVGDGCTPFCEVEPDCSAGACKSRCGDGMLLPSDAEECDDGNTKDHDGCSAQCKIEPGYDCELEQRSLSDTLAVPVTFRDFVAFSDSGSHPDFQTFGGDAVTLGLVEPMLGADGKPVYSGKCGDDPALSSDCPYGQQATTAANFDQWYRDVPGVNVTKVERMRLQRDASTGSYSINNSAFFPWDGDSRSLVGQGREQAYDGHDYGFTSEVRYYFEYEPKTPPQTLTFSGDDDVWVFIDRKLAVDIGGAHPQATGSITLDAGHAANLGLEAGKIYEIALFHAERHTAESNFNLTLDGFVSARSRCEPRCGDGIRAGTERCDDGKNDGSYGSCTPDCQRAPYCGDGKLDPKHEACDDGVNLTTYAADAKPGCAPGCKLSAYCGDGKVDSLAGERCDDGKNSGGYGECGKDCQLGPRCGDGKVQSDEGEQCDDGNLVNGDGCSKRCAIEAPQ